MGLPDVHNFGFLWLRRLMSIRLQDQTKNLEEYKENSPAPIVGDDSRTFSGLTLPFLIRRSKFLKRPSPRSLPAGSDGSKSEDGPFLFLNLYSQEKIFGGTGPLDIATLVKLFKECS